MLQSLNEVLLVSKDLPQPFLEPFSTLTQTLTQPRVLHLLCKSSFIFLRQHLNSTHLASSYGAFRTPSKSVVRKYFGSSDLSSFNFKKQFIFVFLLVGAIPACRARFIESKKFNSNRENSEAYVRGEIISLPETLHSSFFVDDGDHNCYFSFLFL